MSWLLQLREGRPHTAPWITRKTVEKKDISLAVNHNPVFSCGWEQICLLQIAWIALWKKYDHPVQGWAWGAAREVRRGAEA